MEGFEIIGRMSDFKSSRAKEASLEGLKIVLFSYESRIFAFENTCPHQHFQVLHQGLLEAGTITCPMHGRTFNLESGVCQNGAGKLRKFELKIVEDDIWIRKPDSNTKFALFDK